MIKVNINLKNRSWEVKEPLNLTTLNHDSFDPILKHVQKQTNAVLSQLVQEESANGNQITESESDSDDDDDIQPKRKRKKVRNVLTK
ncbi:hypothetical protein Trydic_g20311 [Trypoxylus dichotomus]